MGVIVDTLYVDKQELSILVKKYSNCRLKMQKIFAGFQRYELTIEDESDEKYFAFLVGSGLERASVNYLKKFRNDDAFHRWVMKLRRSALS